MSDTLTLTAHPRLYLGEPELSRISDTAGSSMFEAAAQRIARDAEAYARGTDYEYPIRRHNSLLMRARLMQTRIVTLIAHWRQSEAPRFRDAVMAHVRQMDAWEYWSWIAWRRGESHPEAIFDLSYGENSATLAIAYSCLHETLSDDEKQTFHDIAQRRALKPYLVNTDQKPKWFGRPDSNWNTVCTGGAGMLALAMYEHLDEAGEALRRTETSFEPYMRYLQETGGAWPEGIGYWNYGMRYAFMYLLSHERATGQAHPLIEQPATTETLHFPLDFCPNGVPCSFGDVNRWQPLPFHYAVAHRLKQDTLIPALDRHLGQSVDDNNLLQPGPNTAWPFDAELLMLHPRTSAANSDAPSSPQPMLRRYHGQDWCILADRWPQPNLYASVRGGTTEVPHGHRDLLSFNLLVGREKLLQNAQNAEYLDTTFSSRRQELIEITPQGKNTILVNGVGITRETRVQTTTFEQDALNAVRLDGTEAMGASRGNEPASTCCARLIALLDDDVLLVLDRIVPKFHGRAETRYHTPGKLHLPASDRATIQGETAQLHAAFACDVPAALHTAQLPLTSPSQSTKLSMLRWCSDDLHTAMTMAAAFCASHDVSIALDVTDEHIHVNVQRNGRSQKLQTTLDVDAPALSE